MPERGRDVALPVGPTRDRPAVADASINLSETSGTTGDTVHASATLSGAGAGAGGMVTYTVYSDSACTTVFAGAGTKTVTSGVVPDSNGVQFDTAGSYYWQAAYSGDAGNSSANSSCQSGQLQIAIPSANVASLATVTASSENPADGQLAVKAVDGVIDGFPGDYTREWATAGEGAGAWINLAWSSPKTLTSISLYDRRTWTIRSRAARSASATDQPSRWGRFPTTAPR